MTKLNSNTITKGETIFATIMIIIFFPLVIIGFLFDIITKNRTLYINVNKPWEMKLGDRPNDKT
jgi:hypothetical protein